MTVGQGLGLSAVIPGLFRKNTCSSFGKYSFILLKKIFCLDFFSVSAIEYSLNVLNQSYLPSFLRQD